MKFRLFTALFTFLLVLAAHPDVKPVWELQVRLDGGNNPRVKEWLKLLLPDEHLAQWNESGVKSGGVAVNFSSTPDTPTAGITTVTGTISGTVPAKLFARVNAV